MTSFRTLIIPTEHVQLARDMAAQAYCGADLPKHTGDRTTIWDIPREMADGRFVVTSHDGTGTV